MHLLQPYNTFRPFMHWLYNTNYWFVRKLLFFFLLCAVPRFTGRWFHLCKVDNLIKAAFEQFVLRAVQKEKQELYDFRGNITINSGSQIRSNPSAEFIWFQRLGILFLLAIHRCDAVEHSTVELLVIQFFILNFKLFLFTAVRGCRPGKSVPMPEEEIRALCLKSREIFLQQPILLELEAPLKICGK